MTDKTARMDELYPKKRRNLFVFELIGASVFLLAALITGVFIFAGGDITVVTDP